MSKKENIEEKNAVNFVMDKRQGRKFVWDLLSYCGVYQDIAGDDAYVQRMLGKREVGLYLMAMITEHNENAFLKMMTEARDAEKIREKQNEQRKSERPNDILSDYYGGEYEQDKFGERPNHEYGEGFI